jgi:hypothetical protein
MWPQIIFYIVTLILSIALAPKPKGPRPAAIDDFELPTAEEGRPIPVVFGTVDITGANVLWYGDLSSSKIKKGSLFGSTTIGYKYYLGFHLGLCHGPVDAIQRVTWGDKVAFSGSITANAEGSINEPELFGGQQREGGVLGKFDIMMGEAVQTPNAYLASKLGSVPAYRGIVSLIWKTGTQPGSPGPHGQPTTVKSGYVGNTPYVKPVAVQVKRITKGWQGTPWYTAKANIHGNMNAAHIVYEVLTNTDWGLGLSTALINDTVFRATADTLYDENMGLSMLWNQQATIQDFLQIVLDHCACNLVLRNSTGQFEMLPLRGDYVLADLPVLGASDIIEMSEFTKQAWADTVNELTMTYTDPDTGKETAIVAQDLANIQAQGKRVPANVDRKGVRDHDVARAVLSRELAAKCTPLTKVKFSVNRKAWNLPFGGVFLLDWPERGFNGAVRVTNMNKGTVVANAISVEGVEDIFALGLSDYLATVTPLTTPAALEPPPVPAEGGATVSTSTQTAPPVTAPADGTRYIVPAGATDVWADHIGQIAEYDAETQQYLYSDVPEGTLIFDQSQQKYVTVIGGAVGFPPLGDTEIAARDVSWDDSNANLGVDNVQDAIEAVLSQSAQSKITVRAYANGKWFAQTANLTLYDSTDGENFTARTSLGQTSFNNLHYDPGSNAYFAIRDNQVGFSAVGTPYGAWTWTTLAGDPWQGLRLEGGKVVVWRDAELQVADLTDYPALSFASPGAATSYHDAVVATHPVLYYRMGDEGGVTVDSSGYGNTARLKPGSGYTIAGGLVGEGSGARFTNATHGWAMELRTSADGVLAALKGTGEFAIELWLKREGTAPTLAITLFAQDRAGVAYSGSPGAPFDYSEVRLSYDPATDTFNFQTVDYTDPTGADTIEIDAVASDIFDGDIHHVVARRAANGSLQVWVDKVLIDETGAGTAHNLLGDDAFSTATPYAFNHASVGTFLGNHYGWDANAFTAWVDEVAVYTATSSPASAMSPTRIGTHYDAGTDGVSADFFVSEVRYDTPNARFMVFGAVPDYVGADTEYRPKLYTSADLISFTLLSSISDDPSVDNMQIQQVAFRLAAEQVPADKKHLFLTRNVGGTPDDISAYSKYAFVDTSTSPATVLYVYADDDSVSVRRTPVGDPSFTNQIAGVAILAAGFPNPEVWQADLIGTDLFVTIQDGSTGYVKRVDCSTTIPSVDQTYSGTLSETCHAFAPNGDLWLLGRDVSNDQYLARINPADFNTEYERHGTGATGANYVYDINATHAFVNAGGSPLSVKKYALTTGTLAATYSLGGLFSFVSDLAVEGSYFYVHGHQGAAAVLARYATSNGAHDAGFTPQAPPDSRASFQPSDGNWLGVGGQELFDLTTEATPVAYYQNVIAVMMRRFNSGDEAVLAYTLDGGATWTFPTVSWPTQTPEYGSDALVWSGTMFVATGKGWSGESVNLTSWTFSDGSSNLPVTSRFLLYPNASGRVLAGVRGDFGLQGTLFADDGLHWSEGPEIKVDAEEVSFTDDASPALGAGNVKQAIDVLTAAVRAVGSPDSQDVTFTDPSSPHKYTATNVEAALVEAAVRSATIEGSVTTVAGSVAAIVASEGVAGGLATLDGSGKVPLSQIPASLVGAVHYEGTWNAATNSPSLTNSPLGYTKGAYFVVSTLGTTSLDGINEWKVNDIAIFNGTAWQKIDNTDAVTSVAGRTGAVTLTGATDLGDYATAGGVASLDANARHPVAQTALLDTATDATTAFNISATHYLVKTRVTNAAGCSITVVPNSTYAAPIGTVMGFLSTAGGLMTFVEGAGVTVSVRSGKTKTSKGFVALHKTGTNTWDLVGDLE